MTNYGKIISAAAATLGRKGGLAKSEAKTRAVRENGKKGGRPPVKKWFAITIFSTVDAATQNFSANDFENKKRTTRQWKTFLEKKGYSDFTIKGIC